MSVEKEPVTIGLSERAHSKLQHLKDAGYFREMTDGYRFAIALAIAHGSASKTMPKGKTTFLNVGSLDPDRSLFEAVNALRSDKSEPVYRTAERLAEWGVMELSRRLDTGGLVVGDILKEAESLLGS